MDDKIEINPYSFLKSEKVQEVIDQLSGVFDFVLYREVDEKEEV